MGKKKRFFAQTPPDKYYKARYFFTLDEARVWIAHNGGGMIKMRNVGMRPASDNGLERASLKAPWQDWRRIESWPSSGAVADITAISPLCQIFLDIRADTIISGHDLDEFELVNVKGPGLFRAQCKICNRFVEVTQRGVIYSLLGDSLCRGKL